ncbi:SGNH/GDSL hydrolase family protein [Candidatus Enterococcus leclercqii]|uniref:SGNH/GDSL hydrolase family protein n=1 Tax=Candidatus Enterococcus leclercqii TaxID=1857218 RepID=UPI00137A8220|nr:SGNH/GDSL hydrolase family protein [Enterococcus sp. CU9D]KAF1290779.1 SGNH hydrolase [Enterococcus sp. CU9D]
MKIAKNDRILFVGDSITDSNRNYEALPAHWSSWGDGYVQIINSYTTAFYPELELMVINQGVSGNRVRDLAARWQKDVLSLAPDWVGIMIGVNDVCRHFDGVFYQEDQVSPQEFQETLSQLVSQTMTKAKGVFLLSAFLLTEDKNEPMRKKLALYNQVTAAVAADTGAIYVDVQKEMDRYMAVQSGYYLSIDRVHPSLAGHLLIAKAWLAAAGLGGAL